MALYITNPTNTVVIEFNSFYENFRIFTWRIFCYTVYNFVSAVTPFTVNLFKQIPFDLSAYKYITIKNIFYKPDVVYRDTALSYYSTMAEYTPLKPKGSFSLGFHNSNLLVPTAFTDNNDNLFFYPASGNTNAGLTNPEHFLYNCDISYVINTNFYFSLILNIYSLLDDAADYTALYNNLIQKFNLYKLNGFYSAHAFTIQGEIIS